MNINAFLTFEEEKYKEFRQNPSPFIDAMMKVYNSLPSQQSLSTVKREGVTKVMKNMISRVKHEFEGFVEPPIL